MMHAYDKIYLAPAQKVLARSFDYAVYDLGLELRSYYERFLASAYAARFERGDYRVLVGMSGIELARRVIAEEGKAAESFPAPNENPARSQEYWCGWVLAYYQWHTGFSFREIEEFAPIDLVFDLYHPYHEMDIAQLVSRLNSLRKERMPETELKRRRVALGLSQRDLAERSGVSVRSIQQYEQRQKDINKASFSTVISLAAALHCVTPMDLYEHV